MMLLRKIRRSKWYKSRENTPWLQEGELQADALVDLSTENNRLSMYEIKEDRSNFESVIAALAATRRNISNLDYAIINDQYITDLGIKADFEEGKTPDEEVNACHYDLINLTAQKLMGLAEAIQANGEIKRIQEKEVQRLIENGVQQGRIDRNDLSESVKKKIPPIEANQ